MNSTLLRDEMILLRGHPEPTGYQHCAAALRQGASLHPQNFGYFWEQGKTCALGALAVGLLGPECLEDAGALTLTLMHTVFRETGVLLSTMVTLPAARGKNTPACTLRDAIIYLNDHVKWTREQIATWLESLEG